MEPCGALCTKSRVQRGALLGRKSSAERVLMAPELLLVILWALSMLPFLCFPVVMIK